MYHCFPPPCGSLNVVICSHASTRHHISLLHNGYWIPPSKKIVAMILQCDSMWQLENQRPSIKRCQIACLTACNWGSWADLATLTSTQLSVVTPQASVALLQWVNFHPKNIVFACWWAGDSGTLSDRSFSRERNHPFISMNSFIFSIIILSLVTGWLFSSQTFPCCQYFSDSAPVSCCPRWVLAQQSWIALRLRQTTSTAPPGCEESSPAIKRVRRGTTDFRFENHSNTCRSTSYRRMAREIIFAMLMEMCSSVNSTIRIYINNHQPH